MNREIKFMYCFQKRKTKEIVIKMLTISQVEIQGLNPNPFQVFDWEILSRNLYTGKKDINEKEIYEDFHIVKFRYITDTLYGGKIEHIDLIGVLTFNEDELRYEIDIAENTVGYICLFYDNEKMYDFEVIGNVFDNPDWKEGVVK